MVPETFAPSVSQGETPMTPASGPWVSPMKNAAPGLLQQTGQVLTQAGDTAARLGNTIGDRVQETYDDASVRNAETAFLKTSTGIVAQYTHTRGKDAIDGFEPTQQALDKAAQDAQAGLTNDVQRHFFAPMALEHLVNLGKQVSDHHYQQNIQFGSQAANDTADSHVQLAANNHSDWQRSDGEYARYKGMAIQETQQGALLLGLPVDSPQTQALVKQKTTALAQGVIMRMAQNEQYPEAQAYFDKALAAGEIDERTAEVLGNMIMEGHVSQKGKDLAQQQKQAALGAPDTSQERIPPVAGGSITSTLGALRPGGRTHDGIDIATPVGTQVRAPADGTVTKVWDDDKFGGGLSMEITYPNGNTEGFAHLSDANYQPGQKVTQGAIVALTGKTGDATGPVLHWAMKNPDGQWVDPRVQSPVAKPESDFTDPDMLQKAIDGVNGSDNIQRVKDSAINQLKSDYSTAREIQNQKYQQNKQSVVDQLVQNGGRFDLISAAQTALLRPSDRQDFQEYQDDAQKKAAEIGLRVNWMDHPDQQTAQSVDEAYAKHQLTSTSYMTLRQEAVNLQNDPEKLQQVTIDHGQLTDILGLNQLPNLAFPKSNGDKMQRVELETAIKSEIDAQQQKSNRKLSWNEKGKIARDMIVDKVYTSTPTLWMGGTLAPAAVLTPDQDKNSTVFVGGQKVRMGDIPGQYVQSAIQDLQSNGLPSTHTNIAAWWVKKGRPQQ